MKRQNSFARALLNSKTPRRLDVARMGIRGTAVDDDEDDVARVAYERFELCDMTIDGTDPRWQIWDRHEHCYLPGYWPSRDAAYEGAKHAASEPKA